jgi:hypothetical protein
MSITLLRWLVPAGLSLGVTSLHAQSNPAARQPDPNDPSIAVPAAQYRSSFHDYRYLRDEPVLSWKESNDLVGRIGGWRVYAREAVPAESPAPAPVPPGQGGTGHGGHK